VAYAPARRPLLGATWPELTRHFLEAAAAAGTTGISEEAIEALAALKKLDYVCLPAAQRLALLEALLQAAADAEPLRKCAPLLLCPIFDSPRFVHAAVCSMLP
jgi:hypothetical protein